MNVGSAFNGGGVAAFSYPVAESQEIQVTVSGGLGEADTGGPSMNIIPREGGNRYAGTVFISQAGKWSQGDNLTDELRNPPINITQPAGLVNNWDRSFSMGGPVLRDRVWFYGMLRDNGNVNNVLGNDTTTFPNLNAGNQSLWTYSPDRIRICAGRRARIRRPSASPVRSRRGTSSASTTTTTGIAGARRTEGRGLSSARG